MTTALCVFGFLYWAGMVWAFANVRKDVTWWQIAIVTVFWPLFVHEAFQ